MFKKKKKRVMQLIETIYELIEYINNSNKVEFLNDVYTAIDAIFEIVNYEEYDMNDTIEYIKEAIEIINKLIKLADNVNFNDLDDLMSRVSIIEQAFLAQVKVKLNIVFITYNITMWDSLESIYLAAKEDEDCIVSVVPIPYFDITQDPPVEHYHFDKYDNDINLKDYKKFDLSIEEPDIIYVHNIYDNGNTLTSVLPRFYTSNLKKYTDMLVYSPYCVPHFLNQYQEGKHSYTFDLAGRNNVDKFICAGTVGGKNRRKRREKLHRERKQEEEKVEEEENQVAFAEK